MDPIDKKLQEIKWQWADKDLEALAMLEARIARTGHDLGLITYSALVDGVKFQVPGLRDGKPFEIHVHEWTELDRALIGDFLGLISARSYARAKFMASALVVSRGEFRPSPHFFKWMETLDVLPNLKEDTVLAFWAKEVNKAHKFYSSHHDD
jgi:hypothetical protein